MTENNSLSSRLLAQAKAQRNVTEQQESNKFKELPEKVKPKVSLDDLLNKNTNIETKIDDLLVTSILAKNDEESEANKENEELPLEDSEKIKDILIVDEDEDFEEQMENIEKEDNSPKLTGLSEEEFPTTVDLDDTPSLIVGGGGSEEKWYGEQEKISSEITLYSDEDIIYDVEESVEESEDIDSINVTEETEDIELTEEYENEETVVNEEILEEPDLVEEYSRPVESIGSNFETNQPEIYGEDISNDLVSSDGTVLRNGVPGRYIYEMINGVERKVWEALVTDIPNDLELAIEEKGYDEESKKFHTETTEDETLSVVEKAKQRKKELEKSFSEELNPRGSGMVFETSEGEIIKPRLENGSVFHDFIDKDIITIQNSLRGNDSNITELTESIKNIGLLEPLTVIPLGKMIESTEIDSEGNERVTNKYPRYLLIHGRLRYEAMLYLGYKKMFCRVDTTLPRELSQVLMSVYNMNKPYKFSEKLATADNIREDFSTENLTFSDVEKLSLFESGDWYKGLYLRDMMEEFPEYYKKVEANQLTIKMGFDRLSKDIAKREKEELEGENGGNPDDVDDILRDKGKDDLLELQEEIHRQKVGDRHILDTALRRAVESRDNGVCLCCGFPEEQIGVEEDGTPIIEKFSDLSVSQEIEHIQDVQYTGEDSLDNLAVICPRCHKIVHSIGDSKVQITRRTFDKNIWVRKAVAWGNIKVAFKKHSLKLLKNEHPNIYKQVDKGVLTIGKALVKAGVKLNPVEVIGDQPFIVLKEALNKIDHNEALDGVTGNNEWDVENQLDELENNEIEETETE